MASASVDDSSAGPDVDCYHPAVTMRARSAVVAAVIAGALMGGGAPAARAHRSQTAAARTLDASAPVGYFIHEGSASTGFRPADRQLAAWALGAWQRAAANRIRFASTPEAQALVRVYWAEPTEGLYGEMEPLMILGKRGAAVYIRPDLSSLGANLASLAGEDPLLRDAVVYLTCLHELGHAIGLAHTRDFRDIMYFFGYGGDITEFFERYRRRLHTRADIASVSGMSDGDVARVKSLY